MPPLVYWNAKLSHNGITGYKTFENCNRSTSLASLRNLHNSQFYTNWTLNQLVKDFRAARNDDDKSRVNDQATELLDQSDFDLFLKLSRQARVFSTQQSRKLAGYAKKLAYYSQTRKFESKKSGKYQMRVAFLTLTAPSSATPKQLLTAFNHFLDYLQRTANCVYVWKKEIGEKSGLLHFHLIINNFIPYYIIDWKWKRLLIAAGVTWTTNQSGQDSASHYRIELPRNRKQTAHYIAKYLSKAHYLPGEYGYISGHSSVLDSLKETVLIEDEWPRHEIDAIAKASKVITHDFITHICCDLLKIKEIAPTIGALFEKQYIAFSESLTLTQKFRFI